MVKEIAPIKLYAPDGETLLSAKEKAEITLLMRVMSIANRPIAWVPDSKTACVPDNAHFSEAHKKAYQDFSATEGLTEVEGLGGGHEWNIVRSLPAQNFDQAIAMLPIILKYLKDTVQKNTVASTLGIQVETWQQFISQYSPFSLKDPSEITTENFHNLKNPITAEILEKSINFLKSFGLEEKIIYIFFTLYDADLIEISHENWYKSWDKWKESLLKKFYQHLQIWHVLYACYVYKTAKNIVLIAKKVIKDKYKIENENVFGHYETWEKALLSKEYLQASKEIDHRVATSLYRLLASSITKLVTSYKTTQEWENYSEIDKHDKKHGSKHAYFIIMLCTFFYIDQEHKMTKAIAYINASNIAKQRVNLATPSPSSSKIDQSSIVIYNVYPKAWEEIPIYICMEDEKLSPVTLEHGGEEVQFNVILKFAVMRATQSPKPNRSRTPSPTKDDIVETVAPVPSIAPVLDLPSLLPLYKTISVGNISIPNTPQNRLPYRNRRYSSQPTTQQEYLELNKLALARAKAFEEAAILRKEAAEARAAAAEARAAAAEETADARTEAADASLEAAQAYDLVYNTMLRAIGCDPTPPKNAIHPTKRRQPKPSTFFQKKGFPNGPGSPPKDLSDPV